MNKQQQQIQLRTRKLAVLLFDARMSKRRTLEETAQAAGITVPILQAYEKGEQAPSLPVVEAIAFYLDIPLEHFWAAASLSEKKTDEKAQTADRLRQLRDRMIGASLRMQRSRLNFSLHEVSLATSIAEDQLKQYELGEISVPIPELDLLARTFDVRVEEFFDQKGPIGKWRKQQLTVSNFLELTPELQDFVSRPVNKPYIELAIRLSELSVEKLRRVAEGLLEITY